MISLQELNASAARNALGGAKVPHGVSNPVLRTVDGALRACYFVYTYDKMACDTGEYPRPTEWLALDIDSGELIVRNECTQIDFSTQPFDMTYSLIDPIVRRPDAAFYDELDALFERTRSVYVSSGTFDRASYDAYFAMLLEITPHAYRIFYEELSNVR